MLRSKLVAFLMGVLITIAALLTPVAASAAPLKPIQKWALLYAAQVGAPDNLSVTEQAVIWQESSLCTMMRNPKDPSYGCGGLFQKTAEEAAGRSLTPKQLMTDNKLNIQLSEKILKSCMDDMGTWAGGLVCYNHGLGAALDMSPENIKKDGYVAAIRKRLKEIDRFEKTLPPSRD